MKFAKYLESQSVPEWRKAYINYKALKKRLKAIEKYRRQNEEKEDCRLELVISALENIDPEIQSSPRKYTAPARTQSSTLDNRSTGGQARSLPFASSRWLDRLSKRLNNRQETELGRVSRPTVQVNSLQVASILEEAIKHASEPEQYFFVVLDQDLETISKFYDSKEKEAEAKYEAIEMQVKIVKSFASKISKTNPSGDHDSNDRGLHFGEWFGRSDSVGSDLTEISNLPDSVKYTNDQHVSYNVARSRLKMAITEYYRSLELLKSFKILNETGFRKILKKFDKTAGWKASTLYFQKLNQYHWITSRKIDDLLDDTESLYIKEFAGGHRRKGMNQLRLPERDDHYTPVSWRTGFYLGLALAFFARVIQLALDPAVREQLPNMYFSLQMYACFFLPIIFCVGFSVNALVWTRCHINYKFIFEFNPRDNLDYHQFAELPLLLLLLLSMTMYIDFSQALVPVIPSQLCPLVFFSIALGIMACPFPVFYYSSRKWFWATLGRIFLSYFLPIEFRDFFIADELNSLSYSFWTLIYFFCAYAHQWSSLSANCQVKLFWFTPIVASLPPWWRFLQCLRRYKDSGEKVHLLNALKYITSIAAASLNGYKRMIDSTTLKVAWIISLIINSSYTSAWDIKMDWGILQLNSHHFLLRDDLVFYRWTYYVAAPLNVMLRFAWILNTLNLNLSNDMTSFIVAALEVYRRFQWNFFRLENEHINNCGNFRAIKEIPLPFAFDKTNKVTIDQEEGRIQLPIEPHEIATPGQAKTSIDMMGSFYGRRDFENKQDLEEKNATMAKILNPRPSKVEAVLERIKSRKSSVALEESETDQDDSLEDEDSD